MCWDGGPGSLGHQLCAERGWCGRISTPPAPAGLRPTSGVPSNDNNRRADPPDHALGWSRGGLTCKIHLIVDGRGQPLAVRLSAGQAGDNP